MTWSGFVFPLHQIGNFHHVSCGAFLICNMFSAWMIKVLTVSAFYVFFKKSKQGFHFKFEQL